MQNAIQDLRVSIVQADLRWKKPAENRTNLEYFFAQISVPTDLVLLPEMFTTGFIKEPAQLAEPMNGPTVQWMSSWAKQLDAAIAGSLVIKDEGEFFNRLVWAFPDGRTMSYDKRHLFTLAEEHHHFAQGQDRPIVNWRGWRIMGLICYDLRFPVWARNNTDYDLLFYVANFPDRRGDAWRTLLKARAIENQSYTIGVNRVGTDGNQIYYAGDSCVVDFEGKHAAHLPVREITHSVTLQYATQQKFRQKFAFLQDQDDFQIEVLK